MMMQRTGSVSPERRHLQRLPLCQASCRLDRIGNFGGLDTDWLSPSRACSRWPWRRRSWSVGSRYQPWFCWSP